jgi:hypothetical protein
MVRGNAMQQASEPHVSHAQNICWFKRPLRSNGERRLENF